MGGIFTFAADLLMTMQARRAAEALELDCAEADALDALMAQCGAAGEDGEVVPLDPPMAELPPTIRPDMAAGPLAADPDTAEAPEEAVAADSEEANNFHVCTHLQAFLPTQVSARSR